MTSYQLLERKRRTKLYVAALLAFLVTIVTSLALLQPAPPRKIVLATGQPGGTKDAVGAEYQERLARLGLNVVTVTSNGSLDNLQRLVQHRADVAFVQGGTCKFVDDPDKKLRGLAAVDLEPLWVFYRGPGSVQTLSDLRGKRISVGPPESGTQVVSKLLLDAHGIDGSNTPLLPLSMADTCRQLKEGSVDAAFLVSSDQNPQVQDLLKQQEIGLFSFKRHEAYTRRYPYLTPVKIPEGLFDLRNNIPSQDVTLLAPAAFLACRDDLHPRVVEQLLKTAQVLQDQGTPSLIDAPHQFPSLEGVDLPPHDAAETYMKSGESFLGRHLPYWGVRLVFLLRILVLPLLIIWLPFLKVLPMLYNYRINRLLRRHYTALREAESNLALANTPEELRSRLQVLENLRTQMESLSRKIPAHMQGEVYHWRLHVSLVRTEALDRLQRLETGPAGPPALSPNGPAQQPVSRGLGEKTAKEPVPGAGSIA